MQYGEEEQCIQSKSLVIATQQTRYAGRMQACECSSELTMIPAQCGVSLVNSEGLMANIRKATTVTATPNSSCSRAMNSGKQQPLHFLRSPPSGLSSLLFLPSFLSVEPFWPISSPVFTLSSSPFSQLVQYVQRMSLPACFPPSLLRPPVTRIPAWLLFGNREGGELIWKAFGLDF